MTEKQLIVVVEGTAAMGPFWETILSDYLEKIIRSFCSNELTGLTSTSSVELSLVMFNAHGSYCGCLVQRSGWTRDIDIFFQWLTSIPFAGGGFSDAAIAEGLAEALMMFYVAPDGCHAQRDVDSQRHCILVAASNPYPLPTPVYCLDMQNVEQGENAEAPPESHLSDAEVVAKSFSQCSASLSVICIKQLPKVRAIYNAGKRNSWMPDPPVDNVKNHHFLVLISESFMEACAALSRPGITTSTSNQSPVKVDIASVSQGSGPPPNSVLSVNASVMKQQPISVGSIPTATVKVEPSTVTPVVSVPAFPHMPSVPHASSQGVLSLSTLSTSQETIPTGDTVPYMKPLVSSMSQPLRPVNCAAANVSILNNLSQARQVMSNATLTGGASIGVPSMGGNPMAVRMLNMISSGMASSAAQAAFSSGQPGITAVTGSESLAGSSQLTQNPAISSVTSANSNLSGNSNLCISQSLGNLQGGVTMSQENLSGAQMVQSGIGMNQNIMNALASSVVSSGTGTMIPTSGMPQQAQSGIQSLSANNNPAANMALSQQTSSALQQVQSKYVKVWEGDLSGQRQQQPVFFTRLEGYRSASASEMLAANWPPTMQIARLVSQDHMNNKKYIGKADFLVFRAIHQHRFLGQLQEKKLVWFFL